MAPRFIFLRHGEAEHNVAFHEVGQTAFTDPKYKDAKLTEKGLEQAREVATKLTEYKILDIWSSPLKRCIQTTYEVFEEVSASNIYLHDNLIERLGGGHVCNDRKSKTEIQKDNGFLKTEFLPEFSPLWVERESTTSVHLRMRAFVLLLADLYDKYSEDWHVLIVSSSDAIASLTGKALKNAEFLVLTLKEVLNPPKEEVN